VAAGGVFVLASCCLETVGSDDGSVDSGPPDSGYVDAGPPGVCTPYPDSNSLTPVDGICSSIDGCHGGRPNCDVLCTACTPGDRAGLEDLDFDCGYACDVMAACIFDAGAWSLSSSCLGALQSQALDAGLHP
jgi:hypothetical protein